MAKKNLIKSVGIPVKLYNNLFITDYKPPMVTDFGESNTDKSTYRPDISLIPPFMAQGARSTKSFVYDFPDGKDTNDVSSYTVTYLRNKSLDITEVDAAIAREKSRLESIIASARSEKEAEQARKAIENLANMAQKPDSPSESQESPKESQENTK